MIAPTTKILLLAIAIACAVGFEGEALGQNQADWWSRSKVFRSRYYNVKTDFPEEQARAMAKHMDATCQAYIKMFKGLKRLRKTRLNVYLFETEEDYVRTLRARFKADGTGSQGMCISRGPLTSLVAWRGAHGDDRMKTVLQHEGFHQFARLLFSDLPMWANEGLAEVFGRGVLVDGKIIVGEVSAQDKLRLTAALDNRFKPFQQLFTLENREWNLQLRRGDAQWNYLQAWSITHFFMYADKGKYQKPFLKFLTLLNQGADWRPAWVAAFGQPNFAAMEEKWKEYVRQLPRNDYRKTIRRMEFLAEGMMELRKRDINAKNFNELKTALQEIDFKHTSALFGETLEMDASEEQTFEIPFAAESPGNPTFQLVDRKKKKSSKRKKNNRKKKKSRRTQAPLTISTVGLEPRNFLVRWKRVRRKYKPIFTAE